MRKAEDDHKTVLWVDEICFTRSSNTERTWNRKYEPLKIDMKLNDQKTTAVVAAISAEKGVEMVMTFEQSVNQHKFKKFMLALRNKYPFRPMAIICDNLPAHKTNLVKKASQELNLELIFNVPYSPDYNAIEFIFGKVKTAFKKKKLDSWVNELNKTTPELVQESFNEVTKKDCINCI